MRYIEFFMRNKELNFTIDEERARKILESKEQMILLNDENGEWTGQTINKAEIIGTKIDREKTRDEQEKETNKILIEEPKGDFNKIDHYLDKYKPDFIKK